MIPMFEVPDQHDIYSIIFISIFDNNSEILNNY